MTPNQLGHSLAVARWTSRFACRPCPRRYKPFYLQIILALLLLATVSGCVSAEQLALNRACDEAKALRQLPNEGAVTHIDVKFTAAGADGIIKVEDRVVCEYQGAMCPAGEWFEVWYGVDRDQKYDIQFNSEEHMTFWPHSMCTYLDSYKKECGSGECSPEDYFTFRLQLAPDEAKSRRADCEVQKAKRDGKPIAEIDEFMQCAFPEVTLVSLQGMSAYGHTLSDIEINISNAGL